jgi:dienelactone hydrolase
MRKTLVLAFALVGGLGLTCSVFSCRRAVPLYHFEPSDAYPQPYISDWKILGPFSQGYSEGPGAAGIRLPDRAGRLTHIIHTKSGLVRLKDILKYAEFQTAFATVDVYSPSNLHALLLYENHDRIAISVNGSTVVNQWRDGELRRHSYYIPVQLRAGKNTIMVQLARGIVKKTDFSWGGWDFAIGLRSFGAARKEIAAKRAPNLISNRFVTPAAPVTLNLGMYAPSEDVSVSLETDGGSIVYTTRTRGGGLRAVDPGISASGFYRCKFTTASDTFTDTFWLGDARKFAAGVRAKIAALKADQRAYGALSGLLYRFDHLHKPENIQPSNDLWQRKVINVMEQAAAVLADVSERRDPWRDKTGSFLRSYRSHIDESDQYYLLHVPPQYNRRNPAPAIIITAAAGDPLRPFLESWWMAEFDVFAQIARAADRGGFMIVLANCRGNWNGTSLGVTDLTETLEAVQRDYAVDGGRIFLLGWCGSARDGVGLAERCPNRFAAVGVSTPLSKMDAVAPTDGPGPTDEYAERWLEYKSPVTLMANLANTPMLIIHGDKDEHVPLSESQIFYQAAADAGVPARMEISRDVTSSWFFVEPHDVLVSFFGKIGAKPIPKHTRFTVFELKFGEAWGVRVDQRMDGTKPATVEIERPARTRVSVKTRNVAALTIMPEKAGAGRGEQLCVGVNGSERGCVEASQGELRIDLRQDHLPLGSLRKTRETEGPVYDVFGAPFLVVAGRKDRAALLSFTASWRKRFFTECPWKYDADVTGADVTAKNLVLLGDSASNGILRRIMPRLPLSVESGRITVGNRVWAGQDLRVQLVYPSPFAPGRYVLLMGVPTCDGAFLDAVQVVLRGWYDYAIWSGHGPDQRVIDAGHFNQDWLQTISAAGN